MSIKNREGFTLIELLAVIVILGILMITAIPAVSNSIAKSRKDTYVDNAKKVVDAARTSMASGETVLKSDGGICQYPAHGKATVIELFSDDQGNGNVLPYLLERGGSKSSFGQAYKNGYVIIYNKAKSETTDYYDYYVSLIDKGGNGVGKPVREDQLARGNIVTSNSELTATNQISVCDDNNQNCSTPDIQYTCIIQQ